MAKIFCHEVGDRGRFYYRGADPQAGQPIPYVVWADLESGAFFEELRVEPNTPHDPGEPPFLRDVKGRPLRFRVRRPFVFFRDRQEETLP